MEKMPNQDLFLIWWHSVVVARTYKDLRIVKQSNEAIGASASHPHSGLGGNLPHPQAAQQALQCSAQCTSIITSTSTISHHAMSDNANAIQFHTLPQKNYTTAATIPDETTPRQYNFTSRHIQNNTKSHHPEAWSSCRWWAVIGNCNGDHLMIWESFLTTRVAKSQW